MSPVRQKKIAVFFAGGTVFTDFPQRTYAIRTREDLLPWLERVKEINLVAKVSPFFIAGQDDPFSKPADWDRIYEAIANHYEHMDGFVVVQSPQSFPYAPIGAALAFQGTRKPIVYTGSPLPLNFWQLPNHEREPLLPYHHIGLKNNLLSAVQIAAMDIPEVLMVLGNQVSRVALSTLSRGTTKDPFSTGHDALMGRMEFGLKVAPYHPASAKHDFRIHYGFDAKVVRHYVSPDQELQAFPVPDDADGVLIYLNTLFEVPKHLTDLVHIWRKQQKHVLMHRGHVPIVHLQQALHVHGMNQEVSYMKFIWALGQTRNLSKLQALLDTDVMGETQLGGWV